MPQAAPACGIFFCRAAHEKSLGRDDPGLYTDRQIRADLMTIGAPDY